MSQNYNHITFSYEDQLFSNQESEVEDEPAVQPRYVVFCSELTTDLSNFNHSAPSLVEIHRHTVL